VELDPLSLINNWALGDTLYHARQYDQAIEQERKTLEMDPNFVPAHEALGMAYLQKSMYSEGQAEFEKALAVAPGNAYSLSELGYAYSVAGKRADAQKVLGQLNELSKQKFVPALGPALIYVGLGEKDKALEFLGKAVEDRSVGPIFQIPPFRDSLHSDPRFQNLLRRMNLQP
jgi:tetratricopeptide (TPR) repeat protein